MPDAPVSPCAYPLCPEYAVRGGRCTLHARTNEKNGRGNSTHRGYDAAWRRFRGWFLGRHPLCSDCGRAANEVHHIRKVADHPELRLVESNCMALCKECHSVRTKRGE